MVQNYLIEVTLLLTKNRNKVIRVLKKHKIFTLYNRLNSDDNSEKIFFLRPVGESDPLYAEFTKLRKQKICIMDKNQIPQGRGMKIMSTILSNKFLSNSLDPKYISIIADSIEKFQTHVNNTHPV